MRSPFCHWHFSTREKDGTRVPLEVEVGDRVVLRKVHGEAVGELVTVGDETHYVVDESGLLAVWIDD